MNDESESSLPLKPVAVESPACLSTEKILRVGPNAAAESLSHTTAWEGVGRKGAGGWRMLLVDTERGAEQGRTTVPGSKPSPVPGTNGTFVGGCNEGGNA